MSTSYSLVLALALPCHTGPASELIPPNTCAPSQLALATLFNDAAKGSCALSFDEVRDSGSSNREFQYLSQGLVVTRTCRGLAHSVFLLSMFLSDVIKAGFTFARSTGAPGDQKDVHTHNINKHTNRGPLSSEEWARSRSLKYSHT